MTKADSNHPPAPPHHHERGYALLRLIGAFKLVKALALIAACFAALKLMKADVDDEILGWAKTFHIAPGNRFLQDFLARALSLSQREWRLLAAVLAVYATTFLVEGIGLIMMKDWAEWLTVITTAGLIPFEIYELIHRPGIAKVITLVINIAVVIYLVLRLRRELHDRRQRRAPQQAAGGQSGGPSGGQSGNQPRLTPS